MHFRNCKAVVVWTFAASWVGLLLVFTGVFLRDGMPLDQLQPFALPVVILFWMVGVGLCAYASTKACVFVTVDRTGVTVRWRYPHREVRRVFSRDDVGAARIIESRDDDGDAYFSARADTRRGEHIELVEGHDRDACAEACQRFNDALGREG